MPPPTMRKTVTLGASAFILENEWIRSVLAPGFGARILSLIYKPTETEFAWHSPDATPAGTAGESENVSGFFDCVPTCDPCTYDGTSLPAFGEVASRSWKVLKADETPTKVGVSMEARCKIYPLLLRKEVSIERNQSIMVLRYELRNTSDEYLEYHYSGHNTLPVSPQHRLVLPHEVTKVKLGYSGRLGRMGEEVTWPIASDDKGGQVDLSRVGGPCDGTMENLYTPRLKEPWCAAMNEARREAIGFSFEGDPLRYINVCPNNGGWNGYYFAALEPVTGRPDNLEVAVNRWKDFAVLRPNERATWTQHIIMSHNIKHVERIEDDELIQ